MTTSHSAQVYSSNREHIYRYTENPLAYFKKMKEVSTELREKITHLFIANDIMMFLRVIHYVFFLTDHSILG